MLVKFWADDGCRISTQNGEEKAPKHDITPKDNPAEQCALAAPNKSTLSKTTNGVQCR